MSHDELTNRFRYHPADTLRRQQDHEDVRAEMLSAALFFNARLPEGREKSLAITKLEEAMFWANAAVARQQ